MKVSQFHLRPKKPGSLKMVVEDEEDIWNLYNLIHTGDVITSNTIRKVQLENTTRTNSKVVKQTRIDLKVVKLDYEIKDNELRVLGNNISENEYIPLGSFHTIKIVINSELKLYKEYWDFFDMKQLDLISLSEYNAEVYIQLIEMGMARLFLMRGVLWKEISQISMEIPKFRNVGSAYEQVKYQFFEKVLKNILSYIPFDNIKCFLIAGPGFTQEEFLNWMLKESQSKGYNSIISKRSAIVTSKVSSSYRQSLQEVLNNKTLQKLISNTQAHTHTQILEEFFKMMENSPHRVCYGYKQTYYAVNQKAVEKLLVTNQLFRSFDLLERKKFVSLTEKAKLSKSEVLILSDLHTTGQQLNQITGIAAILRFPLPELDDLED